MRIEKVGPSVDGSRDVWGAEASRAADTTKGPRQCSADPERGPACGQVAKVVGQTRWGHAGPGLALIYGHRSKQTPCHHSPAKFTQFHIP